MIRLKFKKLSDLATIPTKKFPSDAGWDLYSAEEIAIPAHTQYSVKTDVQLAGINWSHVPEHCCVLQLWSRSGMDAKKGLHVGAGIIDQNYRGELVVLLKNMSDQTQHILIGDKIAQLVPLYLPLTEVEEVLEIDETDRGEQGGIMDHYKEVRNVK
jgi:dUTP pyrophosphatase